jgi:glycosyltransferase involved in cell wall biosynthesis
MRSDAQLPIYELAAGLVHRSCARRIIHIGGSTDGLAQLDVGCELIWIGAPETESLVQNQFPAAVFIPANLEAGLPELTSTEIFNNAVVLCLDVLGRLTDPGPLTITLGRIQRECSWLIITTPDCFRPSGSIPSMNTKWSIDEFGQYLHQCGFPEGMLIGLATSDNSQQTKNTIIVLAGREAEFTVTEGRNTIAAIIHVFNEVDILEIVARYLRDQGIDVHLIDNWSTDGSYELGQKLARIGICSRISRFPDKPSEQYEWSRQLEHTAGYAASLEADWIMHYDADEIRCSPWQNISLSNAIDFVDSLNYTAIDFSVINFLFTDEAAAEMSALEGLRSFEWGRHPAYFQQVKTWKNLSIVDLASSGGHDVQFEGRRIYPLKFLTKHYPLRSYNQANRKLYRDRFPRIGKEQLEKGWHVHYNAFQLVPEVKPWRKYELIDFDQVRFDAEFFVERISGIGVDREPRSALNIETQALLEKELASKDTEARRLSSERVQRELYIQKLEGEREAWATKEVELRDEIAVQASEISGLRSELDQRLAEHEQKLSEQDKRVADLERALAERNGKLGALQRVLEQRNLRLTALDEQVSGRAKEVGALEQALEQSQGRVSTLERAVAQRNDAISALHSSSSWRITAPLRSASRVFGWRTLKARFLAPFHQWSTTRAIARSGLFDRNWYLASNPDVAASGLDPIRHYVVYGALEGRDPSPSFSTRGYLSHYLDVAAAGANPLEHFIRCGAKEGRIGELSSRPTSMGDFTVSAAPVASTRRLPPTFENRGEAAVASYVYTSAKELQADCALLQESGLFDLDWYRVRAGIDADIDAVEHYLILGWRRGLEPGPAFEGGTLYPYFHSAEYVKPPAITYLQLRAAGRPAYATLGGCEKWAAWIRKSDLFNATEYRGQIGRIEGLDPVLHYVLVGEQMGYAPSDGFDPRYYLERYPDVARAGISCLGHYLASGRAEGRRPVSVAASLDFECSRINPDADTVLVISHEASRTGAPILAYNVAKGLSKRSNVVSLLLGGGELVPDFQKLCAAVIGPLTQADWHPVEADHIVRSLLRSYRIAYAIANSTESRLFIPALTTAFVPVVSLIHEFASYTRPKGALGEGLDWSTEIVFSTELTADSARCEHPRLLARRVHVLPQGRCEVPQMSGKKEFVDPDRLADIFRPKGYENAFVVLGAGFVHIRKGVDLFLSCAAAVKQLCPNRPVRFVWIGNGYNVVSDTAYSVYLNEQIERSGIAASVAIIDAIEDLEPAYKMSDIFFLSSRLDPLPNVTIDAAFHGLPVVCFEGTSGMASLLAAEAPLRSCVVPHLDVHGAARVIAEFAYDENAVKNIGNAFRHFAETTFSMEHYVQRLDELGRGAITIINQREQDFITIRDDSLFDGNMFLPPGPTLLTREDAIRQFIARWSTVGTNRGAGTNFYFRRPCAGFHPQIYANDNASSFDAETINPLAHFIRSAKPDGPWRHEVIVPGEAPTCDLKLRTALHVHFHYPELVNDFMHKLGRNRSDCDLLLTTNTQERADALRKATNDYARGKVSIGVVPNRGRDIGGFLTGCENAVSQYDLIGHLHSKRSLFARDTVDPTLGDRWREFLWQNLLGGLNPMLDVIVARFASDDRLGIVFPEDPHMPDWDGNLQLAQELAQRMGVLEPLPTFFDFPVGSMFWARTDALRPMFELKLGWDDYPEEPLPSDGTVLHALERLLPFVARHGGFRFATTNVPGVTR